MLFRSLTAGIVLKLAAVYFVLRIIDGAAQYLPPRNHFERGQHLRHLATSSAPDDLVELVPRRANVGAKAKTPPFARCLRRSRWSSGDKTTGRDTLRPIRHRTKTCDEVVPPCDLVQHGGPRVVWPIVTGPAWPLRVTGTWRHFTRRLRDPPVSKRRQHPSLHMTSDGYL